jgi:hypothetical protein
MHNLYLSAYSNVPVKNNSDIIYGFVGVIIGALITFSLTVIWDKYKEKRRFKDAISSVLVELKLNKDRMKGVLDGWPESIKKQFGENGSVNMTDEEVMKFDWSWQKPYTNDSWQALIFSGYITHLSSEARQKCFKAYDHTHSINFLGKLSLDLFKIVSSSNTLDQKTRTNFDKFCRVGPSGMTILGDGILGEAISSLESEM